MVQFSPMTQALMAQSRTYNLGSRPSLAQSMNEAIQAQQAQRINNARLAEYQRSVEDEQRERMLQERLAQTLSGAKLDKPEDLIRASQALMASGDPAAIAQAVKLRDLAIEMGAEERRVIKDANMQEMLASLSTEQGDESLAYIAAQSDDPIVAGMGQKKLADIKDAKELAKEERKEERDIAKEKRKPTEGQTNSFTFATRMIGASKVLEQNENALANLGDSILGTLPGGNYVVSEEYQKALQAARDWVSANLRKESGAAIPPEEMENEIKKYFPQPGDSADVIAQKRRSRERALKGMRKAAGPLAEDLIEGATPKTQPRAGDIIRWSDL